MNNAPTAATYLAVAQTVCGPLPAVVKDGVAAFLIPAAEFAAKRAGGMTVAEGNPDLFSLAPHVYVAPELARSERGGRVRLRSGWYENGVRR